MTSPTSPSIFHRLLLSHVLLLLAAFLAAVALFLYLFAPGVGMFLQHPPLLLLPVILLLILIAAVLSFWTSSSIANQIENVFLRIAKKRGEQVPIEPIGTHGIEEIEELEERLEKLPQAQHIASHTMNIPQSRFVHAAVDPDFLLVDIDPLITDITGLEVESSAGKPFVEMFCDESYRDTVEKRLRLLFENERRITDLVTRISGPSGAFLTMIWNSVPDPSGHADPSKLIHLLGVAVQEQ